ncbi:MAG: response regulator [Lachnospiraceae bacterium]|nr:response regulator [Lachnospiraceae bacterium]
MSLGLMIVDDEELIRQGIRARLDHLGFKFDDIAEADDGESALKLYEKGKYHVIITDIKMTSVSGLQLIRGIKEQDENVQFVIVSGYDDFVYAEEAIRLGVTAYLLKPIANDKLQEVMDRVFDNIAKARRAQSDDVKAALSNRENEELKFEQKINELLNTENENDAREIIRTSDSLMRLRFGSWLYCVGIISIDMDSYREKNMEFKDVNLIRFVIKNITGELSENQCIIANNLSDNKQLYTIFFGSDKTAIRIRSEQLFEKLQSTLWKYAGMGVTIGVSAISEKLCADRLQEAKEAFLQRIIHGNGNLFYFDDIPVLGAEEFPTSELALLKRYTQAHDVGNVEAIINSMLSDEKVLKNNVNYIGVVWIQVLNILLHSLSISDNDKARQIEHEMYNFSKIIKTGSLEEIRQRFVGVVLDAMKGEVVPESDSDSKIILAQKYIEEHYNEDISVSDLAEKFYMSPNYFSTVFKKQTGESTISYMNRLRLERAKKELAETDRSIAEIAELIGYNDSHYFFKLFKKETGITPLQYRRNKQ